MYTPTTFLAKRSKLTTQAVGVGLLNRWPFGSAGNHTRAKGPFVCLAQANGLGIGRAESAVRANGPGVCNISRSHGTDQRKRPGLWPYRIIYRRRPRPLAWAR